MQLIIGNYIIESDKTGYMVSNLVKKGNETVKTKTVYPGTLGRAFEVVLDRRLKKKDKISCQELIQEIKALRDEADKLTS